MSTLKQSILPIIAYTERVDSINNFCIFVLSKVATNVKNQKFYLRKYICQSYEIVLNDLETVYKSI